MAEQEPLGSLDDLRVLRREKVEAMTGLSRSTIYALVRRGSFPKPLRLGPRAVGWRLADVRDWIAAPERRYDPNKAS